jgi:hypothetical protein
MATMYATGGRRSSAPAISPRAALTTGAIYDDQVTKDLIDAMLSATLPAGVGQSQSSVNVGESLGSGTYIDNMFAGDGGGADFGGDSGASGGDTGSVSEGLAGLSGFASGLSALGMIGQNSDMAQAAQALGQVATIGSAVSQAAQGNLGQAAMTVGPMALSALGMPASVVGLGMTAMNPTLGQTDMTAQLGKTALGAVSPVALAALSLAEMMGLVSVKGMVTPTENKDINTAAFSPEAEQEAQALDAFLGQIAETNAAMAAESQAQAQAEEGAAIAVGFGDSGGDSGGGASSAGTAADSGAAAAASASADSSAAGPAGDSADGGGGDSKIICTAMNQAYGFGAFRQVIWLQYAEKHLTKAHEVGYHTLFLPFVAAGYKHNKWYSSTVRKILEHGTRHRTADLRAEMRGTKRDNLGRFYRTIFEPLCWVVGKLKGS